MVPYPLSGRPCENIQMDLPGDLAVKNVGEFLVNFSGLSLPGSKLKNLLMPLFLMGCFPVDFQDVKWPLRTKSVKRPIKVGKRPINEGKRPIKAKVLVVVSVG